MQTVDQLLCPKWIITCDDPNQVLLDHALVIHEGKILDILPSNTAPEIYQTTQTHYFPDHAILPGFVNAHTHIAMNIFRGLADDLELMDWLNQHIWPAEEKWVSPEFVYDGSLMAMAEMIRGGTTTFNDMYFFLEDTAQAAIKAGIRAGIGLTVINVPTQWAKTSNAYFEKGLAFYQAFRTHDRIIPTLAPHSTYAVDTRDLEKIKILSEELQLKINIHLQEAPGEIAMAMEQQGKRPLQRLNELGLVNNDLIAIHMTQINEADYDLLQEKKPNIVHCPESNMKTVSGTCPVETLLSMGVNVALGTDGAASNNDLDMIGEMRTAALVGKLVAQNPRAVSAEKALKMATINGARALGIDEITGSLKPGKMADCIAINLAEIETQPLYDPVSQIVYAASRQTVTDVWVAGQQLMKSRQLLTIDLAEVLEKAKFWQHKLKNE